MPRTRLFALLAAAAALALASAVSAWAAAPKLFGTVGPGFTISLKDAKGKAVKTLTHGKFTFVVTDKASIHNFHLKGPGIDKDITTVAGTGTKTVTLTLKLGTYRFYCVPHESSIHGSFKVT